MTKLDSLTPYFSPPLLVLSRLRCRLTNWSCRQVSTKLQRNTCSRKYTKIKARALASTFCAPSRILISTQKWPARLTRFCPVGVEDFGSGEIRVPDFFAALPKMKAFIFVMEAAGGRRVSGKGFAEYAGRQWNCSVNNMGIRFKEWMSAAWNPFLILEDDL